MAGKRKPNTADWLMFLRSCVPYVMGDTGPLHMRESYAAMTAALNALLDAKADFDPDEEDNDDLGAIRALHLQVIEALCLLERDFPLSELSIFVHEILHVPEFVYRWNAVRNYWCFVSERFVGWMKTFVKNRSLSLENMVHSHTHMHARNKHKYNFVLNHAFFVCTLHICTQICIPHTFYAPHAYIVYVEISPMCHLT
jgi:hypothetical protein